REDVMGKNSNLFAKAAKIAGSALLSAGALTAATSASAQPAANGGTQSSANANDTGEVIITAQRRQESSFKVPISGTAVTSQQLANAGVTSTRDLTTVTPGLNSAMQGAFFQPAIRGITTTSSNLGDAANVALYIDNIYQPFQAGNAFNLANISRVEVLKGP